MNNKQAIDIRGRKYNRTLMVIVMLLGSFLSLLTETFLNNALPSIMKSFSISESTVQWLSTGYLMVAGLMIPISAWIFKRFDVKKTYMVLLSIFLFGSIIAYLSPNFSVLLSGRLIQAIAAGSLMPLIQNVTLSIYPAEKRGAAMGVTGIVVTFAPAVGPTLSGFIIDNLGWRDLFGVLIPITILFMVLAMIFVKHINQPENITVDSRSLVYSTLGFGALLYGFSNIGNTGTVNMTTIVSIIFGIVLLIIFGKRQLTTSNPLIELRIFKTKTFTITTILSALSNIALLGVELIMPLYIQNVLGKSALVSGLVMLPGAIIMGILNPLTGNLYDKYGIKNLSLIGYLILIIGTIPMLSFGLNTNLALVSVIYAIRIVGISFVMMPTYTAGINSLKENLAIYGNAASSTVRQVAGSLGTAILMMIVSLFTVTKSNGSTNLISLNNGYHMAFIVAIIMSIFGFILSFTLKNTD
ncbi:MDR family MFS transporter [Paucilactobacillus suebicus]|nr:MDR family MFS transporter [Paucilactobacillus suebicus]